jgi:hypothetical protein
VQRTAHIDIVVLVFSDDPMIQNESPLVRTHLLGSEEATLGNVIDGNLTVTDLDCTRGSGLLGRGKIHHLAHLAPVPVRFRCTNHGFIHFFWENMCQHDQR